MAGAECRDGCCEEGEWTSTKTQKVKLGRGCEKGVDVNEYEEGEARSGLWRR